MVTNSRPMKIELLGRLVSCWEEVDGGKYCRNDIAINFKDMTYFVHLLSFPTNALYNKGDKVALIGNIMKVESYNNKPRLNVFVEVIESA